MQPARERPLQRADPGQLRGPGRRIHESGRDDAELCNGDPDAGRPHADPGTAVRAVHRRRPRDDVVVRDERPLRDRNRRGPRRLRPIEPRWDDPARGTRARGRHPACDEDYVVRPTPLLLRRRDDEFTSAWAFPINAATKTVPWARDMDRLFGALNVVDNWDHAAWQTVSASNGAQGSGGGAPLVAWSPDFGTGSGTPGPTSPGPTQPAAPLPSLPSLPSDWVPLLVGPGAALGLLLVAFAVSRRSTRSRNRA